MMAKPGKLAGPASKIGRAIGGTLAGKIGGGKAGKAARERADDPIIGAVVGAASLYVAGKLLPRRVAAIGAAVAAGYVTRKLAQRTERMQVREGRTERMQVREQSAERVAAREAGPAITAEPVVPATAALKPSSARASRRR